MAAVPVGQPVGPAGCIPAVDGGVPLLALAAVGIADRGCLARMVACDVSGRDDRLACRGCGLGDACRNRGADLLGRSLLQLLPCRGGARFRVFRARCPRVALRRSGRRAGRLDRIGPASPVRLFRRLISPDPLRHDPLHRSGAVGGPAFRHGSQPDHDMGRQARAQPHHH